MKEVKPYPIQIATALSRVEGEQFGFTVLTVLLSDGRIFEGWNGSFKEVIGPWNE